MSYLSGYNLPQYNDTEIYIDVHPYGPVGGQIFFSFLYMVWILVINVFLLFLICRDSRLRQQPHNIYVFFLCLWDLTIALFYLPVNMDFLVKGFWSHGCATLRFWVVYPMVTLCVSSATVLMLNFSRLLSSCQCLQSCQRSLKTRYILHGLALLLILIYAGLTVFIWAVGVTGDNTVYDITYPHDVGIYAQGETIHTTCGVLNRFDFLYFVVGVGIEAFWAPMYLAIVFIGIVLYRVTRVDSQEKLNPDKSRLPVKVMLLVTLVSFFMPVEYIILTTLHVPAPCALLLTQGQDFTCDGALAGLSMFLQWFLISKSGVLPLVWFTGEEYRAAAEPVIRPLKQLITRRRQK